MAVNTTLAGLSQTAASNGPDGTTDAPSTLDDAIRYALSFTAQLRDGNGFTAGAISSIGAPQASVELNYASTTSVILQGSGGGYLYINGTNYSVGAGITKTLPTLTNATVYNVYAFWTGSAIDLEFSTTTYVATANGIPQKSGDATRTLVGRIRTNSTTTTYNTASDAGVVTYWNRKRRSVTQSIQSNQNTTSGTDVSVLTGPSFISWGVDATDFSSMAINGNSVDTAQNVSTVYVNGSALSAGAYTSISGAGGIGSARPAISFIANNGYTTTALYGRVNAGTGTWYAGSDLQAIFMG
jgi:hypothetical protein